MQNKIENNWFLFDFFQNLRDKVDIDLDLNQYHLFLHVFLSKPIYEISELKFLCETLWLTKQKYRLEFDRYFEEAIGKYLIMPEQKTIEPNISTPQTLQNNQTPDITPNQAGGDEAKTNATLENSKEGSKNNVVEDKTLKQPEKTREINISIDELSKSGGLDNDDEQIRISNFILSSDKYLPFQNRITEQGLRKIRSKPKYISTDELDFQAIIKSRVQEGFIGELPYLKKSIGSQKVIWFSDIGGSMAPFAYWDEQLFKITQEIPNTDGVERYFFHDYPSERTNSREKIDYLFYQNKSFTQPKYLSEILKNTDRNTILIFFSDGGSARKNDDMERVQVFFEVCNKLKEKSKFIRWINPVKNLGQSTGKFISFFVKTEYPSSKGIARLLQSQ